MARGAGRVASLGFAEGFDRLQHVADDVDRGRRGNFCHPVDFPEKPVGEVEHLPEIAEQSIAPAVARILDEQLSIALNCVQRGAELMTQPARIAVIAPRSGDSLCNQPGKLLSRHPHPLEVRNEFLQILPLSVLDENVEEPEDGGNGGPEFLLQKGGCRTLETVAAHNRTVGCIAVVHASRRALRAFLSMRYVVTGIKDFSLFRTA